MVNLPQGSRVLKHGRSLNQHLLSGLGPSSWCGCLPDTVYLRLHLHLQGTVLGVLVPVWGFPLDIFFIAMWASKQMHLPTFDLRRRLEQTVTLHPSEVERRDLLKNKKSLFI